MHWKLMWQLRLSVKATVSRESIIYYANKAHRQRERYKCLDGGGKAASERQSLFSFGSHWLSCNTSLIHVTNTRLHSHTDTPSHSQLHTLTNAFHCSQGTYSHEYTIPLFIYSANRSPWRLLLNQSSPIVNLTQKYEPLNTYSISALTDVFVYRRI